jgi:hypothetical protein
VANEIKSRPDLNPKNLGTLATGRWLLTIVQAQLEAIEHMDPVDQQRLDEQFWRREISYPPGTTPPPCNAVLTSATAFEQHRVITHG